MSAVEKELMTQLAVRFGKPLHRFFERRFSLLDDIPDLVQEVFLRLVRDRNLSDVHQIEGYVFQVARNVLRDRIRRQQVRAIEVKDEAVDQLAEESAFSPERVAIGRDVINRMTAALYELPEKTRMIFVLYHFEGMPQVEIARRHLMSLSTVEKHMARANLHLLRRMGPLP